MPSLIEQFDAALEPIRGSAWLPVGLIVAFLVAGLLFFSVWLVILQCALLLDPPAAIAVAMAGSLASSTTFFVIGRGALAPFVRRRLGQRVLQAVQGASLEHIIAIRVLPILPFTGVNLAAGALGVPFRRYFVGTALGMAPGITALALLGDRAVAVVREPTPASIATLVGAAALLVVVATGLRRWARRKGAA